MNRSAWLRHGLLGLGLGAVLFCGWQAVHSLFSRSGSGGVTLRFSHWQLEPGVRRAFDVLSRRYETLHPGVHVEQLAIPSGIYRQWTTSQLIGGEAPDLVQLGLGVIGGRFFDYFQPITAEVNRPNPYNAGTALARVPWRNTFNDGMATGYDPETFECYGASLFAVTIRFYCNLPLLRRTTGRTEPPATFRELQQVCAEVRDYDRRTGERIDPIAGSTLAGQLMFDDLFRTQTQALATRLDPLTNFPVPDDAFGLAYLNGQWSLRDPDLHAAAELLRVAGSLLPPGFEQIANDQVNFRFVQEQAVMLAGFSLQATGVLGQVSFPVRIFRLPEPAPDDPQFGPQMHGRNAEGGLQTYGGFGLTRASRHPELALDFLQFLTSQASCRTFTEISQSLPAVVGVPAPVAMRSFMPDQHGYPRGPGFYGWGEPRAVLLNAQHLLLGPDGSADRFLAELQDQLGPAIRRDFERGTVLRRGSIERIETSIAAAQHLLALNSPNAVLAQKFQSQVEAQNEMEAALYYTRLQLRRDQHRLDPAAGRTSD
ncbi:MAG: ABC transporter substrate-binding protein [Opitutales bacterium]